MKSSYAIYNFIIRTCGCHSRLSGKAINRAHASWGYICLCTLGEELVKLSFVDLSGSPPVIRFYFWRVCMVIYEITATVDADLASKFELYMAETHISAVLASGYFTSATFSRNGDRYRVQYEADHLSKIDQYLEQRAPMLRADFHQKFPTGVQLSRDIWEVQAQFEPSPAK
jgi:hypothetical protein